MNLPKVSIIVPCYNIQDYVKKCVEGIKGQTYLNWEAIFVDDGSNDNSLQMLEKYTENEEKCKIIRKDNGGVSSARNLGLEHAKGEYIYFCDPDDKMKSNLLEMSIFYAMKNNSDIVVFGYEKVDEQGNIAKTRSLNKSENFTGKEDIRDLFLNLDNNELFNPPWNKLFRKELITVNNIRYERISKGEDAIFNTECFKRAGKISSINDVLYEYLVWRNGSVEMRLDKNEFYFFNLVVNKKMKLLNDFGIFDSHYYDKCLVGTCYSDALKVLGISTSYKNYVVQLKKRDFFDEQKRITISKKIGIKNNIKLLFIRSTLLMYSFHKITTS